MTNIEWTHRPGTKGETWNPVVGCKVVSPACRDCYAMKLAGTRLKNTPKYRRLTIPTKTGPVWNGKLHVDYATLVKPLSWRDPRTAFVVSMGDLFYEAVPRDFIDQVFAVMWLASNHTFLTLTKRSLRQLQYINDPGTFRRVRLMARSMADGFEKSERRVARHSRDATAWPLPNVWTGVTVEDDKRAVQRLPDLAATKSVLRWVSAEPLLSGLDLTPWIRSIDWVVAGGESGRRARPTDPAAIRQLYSDCFRSGVPFFFKQWGEWVPDSELSSDDIACADRALVYDHGQHFSRVGHIYHVGRRNDPKTIDRERVTAWPDA